MQWGRPGHRPKGGFVTRAGAWSVAVAVGATGLVASFGLVATPSQAATVVYRATPVAGYQTNGTVRAVLVVGNTVYVGGTFTQVRGPGGSPVVARANLAAFDRTSGALRTTFSADTNGIVRALASDGAWLYVGGGFTSIKGSSRQRIAKLDLGSGNVSSWTANVNGTVHAIAVGGGRVYAGGTFTTAANQARARVASFEIGSGALTSFNPGADNSVNALAVAPNGLTAYVGGQFATIAGTSRPWLAALTTDGSLRPITFQSLANRVLDLDVSSDGSQVFAAQGGAGNQATAYNAATGQRQWGRTAMGDVQAVRYAGGELYFGFHEGFQNDTTVRMLAADAATGALDAGFRPSINSFFGVWDIHSTPDALVTGGEFTVVNGVASQGFAIHPSIFASDTTPPSTPTGLSGVVAARSVALSWNASTDNSAVSGYRVVRDGSQIAFATTNSYTDTTVSDDNEYRYTVQAVDVAGNASGASAPFDAHTPTSLVAPGAVWRYLDDGSNQGTAWRNPGFADVNWSSGPQELGYGDGDEATVVGFGPSPSAKFRTTYFRQTFTVSGPAEVLSLSARLVRDDGAVVYINGTEVIRTNMPNGTITSSTLASGTADGSNERTPVVFAPSTGLLVAGTNTVAVEIHQVSGSSSDISFAFELDAALSDEDLTPPSMPTGLQVVTTSATTVTLAWSPSSDNVGVAAYVVLRDGVPVATVGSTNFTDTALAPATDFGYRVAARDAAGNVSALSAPVVATTRPAAPTNLVVVGVTPNSVSLDWDAAAGAASYRVQRDGAVVATVGDSEFVDAPRPDGSVAAYTVTALSAAGMESSPAGPVVATTPDITPPSTPSGFHASAVLDTRVTLTWDPSTDNVAVTSYQIVRDELVVATVTGSTFVDTGLTPTTTYAYRVLSSDAASNTSAPTDPITVTTLELAPDLEAPSVPTGLGVAGATTSSVTLVWDPSTDDTGVDGYRILRDATPYAVVAVPGFTDVALVDGESHSYAVTAFDAATNESAASPPVVAAALDGIAPSAPGGLAVVGASSTTITLTWNAATDNVAVTQYQVRRDGIPIATVATTSFVDSGRLAVTTAGYDVVALDAAGNASPPSSTVTGTTLPATRVLVAANATWRYRDTGVDPGAGWPTGGYDDSAWSTGTPQFGYGDGDETTVVGFGGNASAKHITTWFRTGFDLADPGTAQSLTVLVQRDDGAVVYLNGVELVRSNLPAGTVTPTTRASTNVEGAAESTWNSFTVPPGALVAGHNTLAVEVHQNWPGSSDLSFGLQLLASQ